MDKSEKQIIGCFSVVILVFLVGIGIRAGSFGQFLIMALLVLIMAAGIMMVAGFMADNRAGCALISFLMSLLMLIVVGVFIIGGNYQRSTRILTFWQWGKPLPGSEVSEVLVPVEPTETPIPTATAFIEPTQVPTALISDEPEIFVTSDQQENQLIADELNRIWALESDAAQREAVRLGSMLQDTTGEEKQATGFLQAVALERSGQLGAARDAYARLAQDEDSAFGISAEPRLSLLEKSSMSLKEKDKIYKELMNGPLLQGWFLGGGEWRWEMSRTAAARELVVLRSDQLSFRFFQWLHDLSTFSPEHNYLFIFLALTIIARVITLPLTVRSAKLTFQFRRLQPELQYIQQIYSTDFQAMQQKTNELYKRHGLNVWGGCLIGIVDIVIVVWALVSSTTFAPQFILDGAAFGNVADVTTFSLGITIGSFVLMMPQTLISTLIQGHKGLMLAQYGCGSVFVGIVGTLIAWWLDWPAYIFIFWMLLSIFSLAILLILMSVIAVSKRS